MMLDLILELLQCPECRSGALTAGQNASALVCERYGKQYPVKSWRFEDEFAEYTRSVELTASDILCDVGCGTGNA